MKKINVDPDILEGVLEGKAEFGIDSAVPNSFLDVMSYPEAALLIAELASFRIQEEVADIERRADLLGKIALVNANHALELLGGEDGAREVMGDEATEHLLSMIKEQRGDA